MANLFRSSFSFMFITIVVLSHVLFSNAVSNCNEPCQNPNDCSGQLICLRGRCFDDPNAGTQICNSYGPTIPSVLPPRKQPAPAPPSLRAPIFRPPPPAPLP
ncbi:hypothetical protein ERO13_A13G231600v2 [Gossypium hirsutum]|uniref:Carboxypeptidase A inhibitor-like domain-containing protein n=2 Tax=Gossypium TaxID=3633 RepID=A0A2P5YCA3_GOSBA|nr:hypothetical protein ES319_A13G253600v1 [Gossypium barbadense]KAG4167998.1 hypothetical protein ERO13_A13G231600v2 [Gossypium hirsutum]PPS13197.1 hypothetical protein GOBAR_AA07399 [Gossypium barbadense]TYH93755.1 hypothetical protein ES332_A13G275600v1 [Gossypium tomentosum]